MQRIVMKSKIHRATVTRADLHYEGSYSIDPELMRAADIVVGEQLHIVNGYYATYLRRSADPLGEQTWLALLQSGETSPAAVAEAVLASDEYFARVGMTSA